VLQVLLLLAGFEAPTVGSLAMADADTLLRRMPSWALPVQGRPRHSSTFPEHQDGRAPRTQQ
jgi:hypothetical protein